MIDWFIVFYLFTLHLFIYKRSQPSVQALIVQTQFLSTSERKKCVGTSLLAAIKRPRYDYFSQQLFVDILYIVLICYVMKTNCIVYAAPSFGIPLVLLYIISYLSDYAIDPLLWYLIHSCIYMLIKKIKYLPPMVLLWCGFHIEWNGNWKCAPVTIDCKDGKGFSSLQL